MNSNLINYLHPKQDVDKNEMLNASSVDEYHSQFF